MKVDNSIDMQISFPLVSVIIPVYNAERTLKRCLDSLLWQTQIGVECIVVDDCSTDRSVDIINEFIFASKGEDKLIRIVQHSQNRGVAAARNTGLSEAKGNYLYYVDADDWIEPDTLRRLVEEAQTTNADIVGHTWYLTFEGNERRMNQPVFGAPVEALRSMMAGVMRWNLWLFLVRRSLYEENNIRFLEGMNMGEDMMVMMKLFVHAREVTFVDIPFYHYLQTNSASLTKIYSEKHIQQVTANVNEVERYLKESCCDEELVAFIPFLKLNIKLPLLITDEERRYQQWLEWFPESNCCIMHNKYLPLRTRLLQFAASKRYFFLVKLYYQIVIRFVYGVIYK